MSFSAVTLQQLQAAGYGGVIDGSDGHNLLQPGTVFAVHTRSGYYAKVRVDSFGPPPWHTLGLTMVTYGTPPPPIG